MKKHVWIILVIVLLIYVPVSAAKLPQDLIDDAVQVLREIGEQPDTEQLHSVLRKGSGIAIFPSVVKAGIGIGGRYGEGLVLQYNPETKEWSGPYFVTMKGVSYGFQVGVQSTALVLVVTSPRGMESLQDGSITLGGNLSVAAGPIGRSAEAGTDVNLKAAMYSYSLSKGAFIGASLEGAGIDNNVNANQVYWGQQLTPGQMLTKKPKVSTLDDLISELEIIMSQEVNNAQN